MRRSSTIITPQVLAGVLSLTASAVACADYTELFTVLGDESLDYLGNAVSGLGDVNDDGFADVIVGSRGENGDAGRVWAYSGADGSVLWQELGAPNAQLG